MLDNHADNTQPVDEMEIDIDNEIYEGEAYALSLVLLSTYEEQDAAEVTEKPEHPINYEFPEDEVCLGIIF